MVYSSRTNRTSPSDVSSTTWTLATFPCIGAARVMVDSYCTTVDSKTNIAALTMVLAKAQLAQDPFQESVAIHQLCRTFLPPFRNNHSKRPVFERFMEKVAFGVTDCWYWIGAKHHLGYGLINAMGETKAHRVAWKLFHGLIPEGMHVLHRCDVRCCVNPEHLWLGTHAQNMQDMSIKGRNRAPRLHGAANPMARLTPLEVEAMRHMRTSTGQSYKAIGQHFGVTSATAYRAISQQSWQQEEERSNGAQ